MTLKDLLNNSISQNHRVVEVGEEKIYSSMYILHIFRTGRENKILVHIEGR